MKTRHPTRIITSLNLKGGVGKTHVCWLTIAAAIEKNKRCLVLDLDKQANITTSLRATTAPQRSPGCEQFFDPSCETTASQLVQTTSLPGVDLIAGGFALEEFNLTNPAIWAESDLHLSLVEPMRDLAAFYDYIFIDCPADISLLTYSALCASNFLVVPLEAAEWGALGPQHVVKTFEHVKQHYNAELSLLGFVVSRFKKARKHQKEYLSQLRRYYGDDAFETVIPDSAKFEQSVNERIPITFHSPSSHASSIARQLFAELEERCERLECSRNPGCRPSLSKSV